MSSEDPLADIGEEVPLYQHKAFGASLVYKPAKVLTIKEVENGFVITTSDFKEFVEKDINKTIEFIYGYYEPKE